MFTVSTKSEETLHDSLNADIHVVDTGSDTLRQPAMGLARQQRQQIARDEHENGNEYILGEESYGDITGSDQLDSFITKIDEAGHGFQAKTLFARPPIVLGTNS